MEFLKMKRLRKLALNKKPKSPPEPPTTVVEEEPKEAVASSSSTTTTEDDDEEDDDDFIMNEVKRRLKELKRNSFMVLIPEEETTCPEEEQEEEETTCSTDWRDVEAEARHLWSCFGAFYDTYCDRMLFFDRLATQLLKDIGLRNPSTPSPRSVSKKLTSPLRCLSLKKIQHPDEDDTENLQQPDNDPYLHLETLYVSQLCLTWEALHCQYTQLTQQITSHSDISMCYNHSAQQFQQFQVLLQRFIENEPFQRGLRPEIYAHTRNSFSKLLQVPNILGQDRKEMTEEESETLVHATDLIRIIESSILTFQIFIKMDKNKSNGVRNLFGGHNQMLTPLQQVQSSLEKKKVRLKEMWNKRKTGKKNLWPATQEEVELLLGLIDVKVISRVLRMVKISKEQLFWSEEKMKKLDLSATGKLQRDPSPILFPY
uniref:uncharacterized protein LOC122579122 n=1 Tax=Erigeron canadensis TaxID=72917 RepID=UPI001CB9D0F3|nr:uncharacterized protein LOC122579122 [Erigeron canadensis]